MTISSGDAQLLALLRVDARASTAALARQLVMKKMMHEGASSRTTLATSMPFTSRCNTISRKTTSAGWARNAFRKEAASAGW